MLVKGLIVTVLIISMLIPVLVYFKEEKKKSHIKGTLLFNTVLFFGTIIIAEIMMLSGNTAFASGEAEAAAEAVSGGGMKYLAAALSTGMSCIGAGVAVSSSASAALGALSENEGIMGKALIFVALAESIALYGLIISFTILG